MRAGLSTSFVRDPGRFRLIADGAAAFPPGVADFARASLRPRQPRRTPLRTEEPPHPLAKPAGFKTPCVLLDLVTPAPFGTWVTVNYGIGSRRKS